MTERIITAYHLLSPAKRLAFFTGCLLIFIAGWVAAAMAAGGISFNTLTPGNSTVVGTDGPPFPGMGKTS